MSPCIMFFLVLTFPSEGNKYSPDPLDNPVVRHTTQSGILVNAFASFHNEAP